MTAGDPDPIEIKPDVTGRFGALIAPPRRSFDVLAFVLTGLMIGVVLGGKDRFWVAWVALAPALCVLYRSGFKRAFLFGVVAGITQCIALWYWVAVITKQMLQSVWIGIIFMTFLCVFFGLLFGMFYSLVSCLIRALGRGTGVVSRLGLPIAIACLWIALEYGYSTLLFLAAQVFPMGIGYSQWNHPSVIQLASITGVFGISFLIVAFNAAVADDLYRRRLALVPWVGGFIVLCICAGHLWLRASPQGSQKERQLTVTVLQGNIPAFDKFDRRKAGFLAHRYLELGEQANRTRPDIIVWTESAIPWPLREDDDLMTTMLRITEPSHAYHILGATFPVEGASNTYYNSVFFVHPNGDITAQYDKRNLLTFVERTIHIPIMPASGTIHPAGRKYLSGTRPPLIESPVGRFGVMLCNENLYAPVARESIALGGEYMVHLANDAWFLEDGPIDCHFGVALFRAVETRRDTVIANNIGISAIIDAYGRILTRSEKRTHACLTGKINRRGGKSFYVMVGDLFAQFCACLGLVAVIFSCAFAPRADGAGRSQETGNGKPESRDSRVRKQGRRDEAPSVSRGGR